MCRTPTRHSSIAAAQDGSAGKNEFSLLATPAAHACTVHALRGDKYASLVFVGTSMIMIHWTSEFDKVTVVLPRLCCLWAQSAIKRQKACIATLHSQKHRPQLRQKPAAAGPALPAWLEDDVPVEGSVADVHHLPYPHEALHLSKACVRKSIFVSCSTT